jgi:hypothetical protein
MGRGSSALSGAGTGAAVGSAFGPIGTGVGAGVGALIGALTGGKPKEQKDLEANAKSLQGFLWDNGKNAFNLGDETFRMGIEGFEQPQNFWSKILGGNRDAMMDTMAPEVSTIVSQYDAGRKAVSEFGARGGGKNSTLAELPMKQSGDINRLFQSLRPEAAKQLSSIAQVLASLGLNEEQISTSLLSLQNNSMLGVGNIQLGHAALDAKTSKEAGEGLGKLLAAMVAKKK